MFYQLLSIFGAVVILFAYGAAQLKKLRTESALYQLLNFIGGAALCGAAVAARQSGFILLEGAWTILSAWGLAEQLRALRG
jgi:hypothetical protein